MLPDGSEKKMRRLRYTGPGAVLVTVAHECIETSGPLGAPRLTLRELPEQRALHRGAGDRARARHPVADRVRG